MRENTPEIGVELRGTATEPLPQGTGGEEGPGGEDGDSDDPADSGEQVVLRVAVPVPNPQSNSRDSFVDGDDIVGRIPVANADTPCADELLDAAAVTVLQERVAAYYPRTDEDSDGSGSERVAEVVALVWEAATDDWHCEEWDADGEFDVETDRRDDDESVLWERDESTTA